MSTFQALYDSEINYTIIALGGDGFHVKLGDDVNGFKDETKVQSWVELEAWLGAMACFYYPSSAFTRDNC